MSTRSITHIHEMKGDVFGDEEQIVCSFYRHCDGYPTGHGQDLADWLTGKRLVNGISGGFVKGRDFNRSGSMAVHLMAHIESISGCEVVPTGAGDMWEEYTYDVYFRNGEFVIGVNGSEYLAWEFNGSNVENEETA